MALARASAVILLPFSLSLFYFPKAASAKTIRERSEICAGKQDNDTREWDFLNYMRMDGVCIKTARGTDRRTSARETRIESMENKRDIYYLHQIHHL
jgi:hypothetical protein